MIPNFGRKSIEEVKENLEARGPAGNGGAGRERGPCATAAERKALPWPSHRKALYMNLCRELFDHQRIQTTEAKAKAVKPSSRSGR